MASEFHANEHTSSNNLKVTRLSADMSPSSPSSTHKTQIVVNLDGNSNSLQNITTTTAATNMPISVTIQPNNLHGSIKSNRSTKSGGLSTSVNNTTASTNVNTLLKSDKTKPINLLDRFNQQATWKRLTILLIGLVVLAIVLTPVTILILKLSEIYLCNKEGGSCQRSKSLLKKIEVSFRLHIMIL